MESSLLSGTSTLPVIDKCCACQRWLGEEALRFPKDVELRKKWVDAILATTPNYPGKQDVLKSMGIRLCLSHFDPDIVIKKSSDGQTVYGLKRGGVPSIFTCSPNRKRTRLSHPKRSLNGEDKSDELYIIEDSNTSVVTETPVSVIDSATNVIDIADDDQNTNSSQGNDAISSLQHFMTVLRVKKDSYYDPWKLIYLDKSVLFCLFDNKYQHLVQSFQVGETLKVTVNFNGQPVEAAQLSPILGSELVMDTWTKFKALVVFLLKSLASKDIISSKLKQASTLIHDCSTNGLRYFPEKVIKKWKFLSDQITVSIQDDPIYSPETIKWALEAYKVNKAGYIKIFNSGVITLPHPASLEVYLRLQKQNNQSTATAAEVSAPIVEQNTHEVVID